MTAGPFCHLQSCLCLNVWQVAACDCSADACCGTEAFVYVVKVKPHHLVLAEAGISRHLCGLIKSLLQCILHQTYSNLRACDIKPSLGEVRTSDIGLKRSDCATSAALTLHGMASTAVCSVSRHQDNGHKNVVLRRHKLECVCSTKHCTC